MYRLRRMAKLASGKTLDVGFTAQPNIYLKGEVYGLDITSPRSLPANYKGHIVHDALRLDELTERYDTILAGEIIEHLETPLIFLAGCHKILNPGGRLVISTPNPYYPPIALLEMLMIRRYFYNEGHVNLYLPRFMVRMMERCNFTNVHVYSGGTDLPIVKFDIPFPYPFCGINLYLGQKSY